MTMLTKPTTTTDQPVLRMALPKGRMQQGVIALLGDAGIRVHVPERGYRPSVSLAGIDAKMLKPQNIIEMLDAGTRDIGFAGADWVAELGAKVVDVLDTGLDPVRIVAAAPRNMVSVTRAGEPGTLPNRPLVMVSEYVKLTTSFIERRGKGDKFVRSYGATEVFPPEDADCIVDCTATGSTLEANGLAIVEELMRSSTRLYASRAAMDDTGKRARIEDLVVLLRSVLDARKRVMLELNCPSDKLEAVTKVLPCMREPTISKLHHDAGYAVKAAVPKDRLPTLIPQLKAAGGSDIVISPIAQVVS